MGNNDLVEFPIGFMYDDRRTVSIEEAREIKRALESLCAFIDAKVKAYEIASTFAMRHIRQEGFNLSDNEIPTNPKIFASVGRISPKMKLDATPHITFGSSTRHI
jgi:hypothetical protein